MGSGRNGRRSPAAFGLGDLASEIFSRVSGGHPQPGAQLSLARLSDDLNASAADILAALAELERAHAVVRNGDGWVLASQYDPLLARHRPQLEHLAADAAPRITPAQAAGLLAAFDRLAGLAGDGSAESRAQAYGLYLHRLADAVPDPGHAQAVAQYLAEAAETVKALAQAYLNRRPPDPDAPLARLARAMMAGNTEAAEGAFQDHLAELDALRI
ncbi:MAG: hypothetical protein DI568_07295 [Sphingomonas sp.]|nr:MAG: hypothetical protein DI568_07295 [Sphingomonas sp.]